MHHFTEAEVVAVLQWTEVNPPSNIAIEQQKQHFSDGKLSQFMTDRNFGKRGRDSYYNLWVKLQSHNHNTFSSIDVIDRQVNHIKNKIRVARQNKYGIANNGAELVATIKQEYANANEIVNMEQKKIKKTTTIGY